MFCSYRISTDNRVARSLCHSRASCFSVGVQTYYAVFTMIHLETIVNRVGECPLLKNVLNGFVKISCTGHCGRGWGSGPPVYWHLLQLTTYITIMWNKAAQIMKTNGNIRLISLAYHLWQWLSAQGSGVIAFIIFTKHFTFILALGGP